MHKQVYNQVNQILLDQRENCLRHFTWEDEKKNLQIICNGALDRIGKETNLVENHVDGLRTQNTLQDAKYRLISAITLFSRAAIEGGVPDTVGYAMSDSYIMACDQCTMIEQVEQLYLDAFFSFTKMVSEHIHQSYSIHTENIIHYILLHLHESITLQNIAKYCSLSPTYCSHIFKSETGMPISHYIQKERINSAKYLLKYSSMTLSQIALYLGFSNQSHFSRTFKTITNQTPHQFRKRK